MLGLYPGLIWVPHSNAVIQLPPLFLSLFEPSVKIIRGTFLYELEQGRYCGFFCEVFCQGLYLLWLLRVIIFPLTRDWKDIFLFTMTNKDFEVVFLW